MGTVLALPSARLRAPGISGASRLIELAATQRHDRRDVRWFKENAEVLRLLVATGQEPGKAVDPELLARVHGAFADELPDLLRFFPQYYRFHLSIALDLAALGLDVDARGLVAAAFDVGLPEAELSDLQRAEARLFAQRAGVGTGVAPAEDADLTSRLLRFAGRAATFALPNKKAAYELTHIAFYLSDYGRHDFEDSGVLHAGLLNVGLVAWLEQNTDLLAEVCMALRYCGATPPEIWEDTVSGDLGQFRLTVAPGQDQVQPAADDFHCWIMAAWSGTLTGRRPLDRTLPASATGFVAPRRANALVEVSHALLDLGSARSGDWPLMRRRLAPRLAPGSLALLDAAAAATPAFDAFFASFARANPKGHAA